VREALRRISSGLRAQPAAAAAIALALALFAAAVLKDIDVPGVYMDAVNPDYLVVPILHPTHPLGAVGVMPGNYLARRLPVLTSLYHGTETVWFSLPFYALLGVSLTSLRIVHGLFGIAVLACALWWLRRSRLDALPLALAGVAIASDPAFVFAFRSQSTLTLLPSAWLLLSLIALDAARTSRDAERWRFRSGIAFGLAFFGYFIYLFYLPALLLALLFVSREAGRAEGARGDFRGALVTWSKGAVLGAAGYLVGYFLMLVHFRGFGGLAAFLDERWGDLRVFNEAWNPVSQLRYAWTYFASVLSNSFHDTLMIGRQIEMPGLELKVLVLAFGPPLLWLAAELARRATLHLRMSALCAASFFLCTLVFGRRLGGHHFMSLLLLAYLNLALGLAAVARSASPAWQRLAIAAPLVLLSGINFEQQGATREALRATGGVGNFSDAIVRLANDSLAEERRSFYFFPEWGFSSPFGFLTAGRVDYSESAGYARARSVLCKGTDVKVALFGGDNAERFGRWTRELDWDRPQIVAYRQRDGVVAFELARFTAAAPAARSCADAPAAPG
jgi:hypothetical protein